MKVKMGISLKLALVFVLFAAILLGSTGVLVYTDSKNTLQEATISELQATALEKQAALEDWANHKLLNIESLSELPELSVHLAELIATDPGSDAYRNAHDQIIELFKPWASEKREMLSIFVMHPETSRVIVSLNPLEEGKFKESSPYFIYGQEGPFLQNPYYSLAVQELAMTASAPIKDGNGLMLGVLAGRVNLGELNRIVSRSSGLRQTEDAYLVNPSNLFITQPRGLADPAVLRFGIHTKMVESCLAQESGVTLNENYLETPVISIYRWLPDQEYCLVVELEQSEAFAPIRALAFTLLVGLVVAMALASLLAVGLARTITRPVLELQTSAARIGQGDLDYRIALGRQDEIGKLAQAFNEMTSNLQESLGMTARSQNLLLALSQAAQSVQRARTPEEIYDIVGDEWKQLGGVATVLALTEDRQQLHISYTSFKPTVLRAAEKMLNLSFATFRIPVTEGNHFHEILYHDPVRYHEHTKELVIEVLPIGLKPLAGQVTKVLGNSQTISARLTVGDHLFGMIVIAASELSQADLPAISAFANQTSIALENTHLYQETQAWAQELEQRVEQRSAELKESRDFSDAVINSLPGVFYMFDQNGKFVRWNQNLEQVTEYTADEISTIHPLQFFAEEQQVAVAANIQEVFATGKANVEADLVSKSGQKSPYYFTGLLLIVADEPYVAGIGIDITERKRMEETLRNKTAELERSNQELEQFAYVASHDLQEPLRMVSSYTQLLARRYQDRLDEDAHDFIQYAVDGASRMQRLITDLLAYSRVGTRGKDFEPTDLNDVLAQIRSNLSITIEESCAIITHDELPLVIGDEGQLVQMLQNLIANAIKFRGELSPQVHISATQPNGSKEWLFSVKDNGIGIDPQHHERIFVIFQRLHNREQFTGTGIGLAVVKRIVERHDGRIWVESQPGDGATFSFTLTGCGCIGQGSIPAFTMKQASNSGYGKPPYRTRKKKGTNYA